MLFRPLFRPWEAAYNSGIVDGPSLLRGAAFRHRNFTPEEQAMAQGVYTFSPGPAVLPLPVLQQAQRELVALEGIGISPLEMSHRSEWFAQVLEETTANLRRLLRFGEDYTVLYLQGGSRLQFSMVPMNLLRGSKLPADYILTGSWGNKAVAEARREGTVHVAYDGKEHNYRRVPQPDELELSPEAAYVHFTSNETIQGVQFREPPPGGGPLVCDASSDFLSRPIEVDRFGLIYACAQKNAGPAGVTVVIIRNELLDRVPEGLHSMLDYRQHARAGSLLNTAPVFACWVVLLVTRWLLEEVGSLEAMEQRNRAKAQLLYEVLDQYPDFYIGHADPESRSLMNVTFRLPSEEQTRAFLAEADAQGLKELKGHRSVGGIRASIYNAMPVEGVEKLREFMLQFVKRAAVPR